METALRNMDGSYNIPNFRVRGNVCRTNTNSNTSFRAFGNPQVLVGLENMISHVAKTVGKTAEEVGLILWDLLLYIFLNSIKCVYHNNWSTFNF